MEREGFSRFRASGWHFTAGVGPRQRHRRGGARGGVGNDRGAVRGWRRRRVPKRAAAGVVRAATVDTALICACAPLSRLVGVSTGKGKGRGYQQISSR